MKNGGKYYLFLAALGMLAVASAQADTSTNTSTTEQSNTTWQNVKKTLALTYVGAFYGPGIGSMDGHIPDPFNSNRGATDFNNTICMENIFSLGVHLGNMKLVAATDVITPLAYGNSARIYNSFIRLTGIPVYKSGDLSIVTDARLYVPVFSNSLAAEGNRTWGARITPVLNYQLGPRWSASVAGVLRFWAPDNDSKPFTSLDVDLLPSLTYMMNDKFGYTFGYEIYAAHNSTKPGVLAVAYGYTLLTAGVTWDVTPSINFNPYLQAQPDGRVDVDTVTVGANISAAIL